MGQNVQSNQCYSSSMALAAGVGCPSTVGLKLEPQLLSIYVSTSQLAQDRVLEKSQQIILVCTKKSSLVDPIGTQSQCAASALGGETAPKPEPAQSSGER